MAINDQYGYNFSDETIIKYLSRLKNNIYKLLCLREENGKWREYLESLIELELKGCEYFFTDTSFVELIVKLCSIRNRSFYFYRKGIFESIKIIDDMIKDIKSKGEIKNAL